MLEKIAQGKLQKFYKDSTSVESGVREGFFTDYPSAA
jgi:hypothetical protein